MHSHASSSPASPWPRLLPLAVALAAAWSASAARADEAAAAPGAAASAPAAADQPESETLQRVVVTGTASMAGKKLIDTSFSITTADADQIKEAAPSSTADLLKIVPGIYVESSGGETGPNIEVRGFPTDGDAPYVTMQLDGSPLYPAPTLSFMDNSSLLRIDETIERVEVLRGGPSPIWSNGQAGATANFILKKGSDEQGGLLRYTTGTGDLQRVDLFYGGKLSEDWAIALGGFYRTSDGVRDTGYPSDDGGQFTVNLTHKLDGGELSLWGRVLRDKNTFFTGIPLVSTAGGNSVQSYPGLSAQTGALQGPAMRLVQIETTPGSPPGTMNLDLANGRGAQTQMVGMDFSKRVGAVTFSDKAAFMSGDVPTTALFTNGPPQSLADYIAGKIATANATPAVVAAAGGLATAGSASFVGGGAITDLSQQVMSAGIWYVDKNVHAFTNDARVNVDAGGGHTLSLGLYLASDASHDLWYLGNSMVITPSNHAQLVNVALNNGVKVTRNGFDGAATYALDASYNGTNTALTLADEWKISPQVDADAGLRWEHAKVSGSVGQPSTGDLDGNPLTLYDNSASYLSGTYAPIDFSKSKLTYTLGGSYLVSDTMNLFARLNSGARFPAFDDLRSGDTAVETSRQYEVGLKTGGRNYSLFLTAFYNQFRGQPFSQILADGTTRAFVLASNARGLEFEGALRPLRGFTLTLDGDLMRAHYENSGTLSGNEVQRQPQLILRFTPSYRFNTGWGDAKLFATVAHVGKRFSDVDNEQPLPAYTTLDAGLIVNRGDLEFRLMGTNLSNTLGITEGNVRVVGSGTNSNGAFIGRPLFGRALQASVAYHF
ncbi:MAG: TonB-dependent receptor [Pelomonas sp.]|nr:TonB-dependent receptor [Roseateles sp.]